MSTPATPPPLPICRMTPEELEPIHALAAQIGVEVNIMQLDDFRLQERFFVGGRKCVVSYAGGTWETELDPLCSPYNTHSTLGTKLPHGVSITWRLNRYHPNMGVHAEYVRTPAKTWGYNYQHTQAEAKEHADELRRWRITFPEWPFGTR